MRAPPASLPSIFERADDWFFRAKSALLGGVPCRKGCCRCCIGPFAVTLLDIEELHRGLQMIPAGQRRKIQERARRQVTAIEARYPPLAFDPVVDSIPDEQLDQLVTEFADMPCPALQKDGACGLYEFRPVTCRTMGIPIETTGTVSGACDTQTFIPIVRLSQSLRAEEDDLAEQEARLLEAGRDRRPLRGDEVLLPYGFLLDLNRPARHDSKGYDKVLKLWERERL
jgi:Fe-S-cluster containining protein